MTTIRRWLSAFGAFWWDFLIGDSPEFVVTVVAVVVVALLLRHHHTAAIIVLPLMVVASLVASTLRGRAISPSGTSSPPVQSAPSVPETGPSAVPDPTDTNP